MSLRVSVDAPDSKKTYILEAARWRIAAALAAHERANGPRLVVTMDHRDIYFLTLGAPIVGASGRRGVTLPNVEQGRISLLMCALAEAPHAIPEWRTTLERSASGRARLRCERRVSIPPLFLIDPQAASRMSEASDDEGAVA